jgi:Dolichyl-phosphate-mannose-protein mannosyltransferase
MTNATLAARPSPLQRLIDVIEAAPDKVLVAFVLFHTVLWTVIPTLVSRNLPLDLIEGIGHGRDWHLGYWKHPPLTWWLDDLVRQLAGNHVAAFFLLGQLTVALCFWAMWRFGCEFLRPIESLIAVALLDGVRLFNALAMEFNHNVLQLPIWALAGWVLYRAFVAKRIVDWIWVGVCFAVAFYAKYAVMLLIIPVVLFAIVDPVARRCWRTPGPYLAMLLCAVLLLPHAIWLVANDFSPIGFVTTKSEVATGLGDFARYLWQLVIAVIGQTAVVLLMFAILQGPRRWQLAPVSTSSERFARDYMMAIGLGPLALTVAGCLFAAREIHSGWTWQFWPFLGLLLMTVWRPVIDRAALTRIVAAWGAVTVISTAVVVITQSFHVSGGVRWANQFPGDRFTAAVLAAWDREARGAPLTYVVGDFWPAGNVILNMPDPPHLLQDGDLHYNPDIDVADVRRRGAMLLWTDPTPADQTPDWLQRNFPEARVNPPLVIHADTPRGEWSWRIGWAVLPPRGN